MRSVLFKDGGYFFSHVDVLSAWMDTDQRWNQGFVLSKLTDKQRYLGVRKYSCSTLQTETSIVNYFASIKINLINLV